MMGMIVTIGCMMLLLRISVSLISVQMAQYIAFAAARAHSAADVTPQDQVSAGEAKYKKLLNDAGIMAGFLKAGDTIQNNGVIGIFNSVYHPAPGDEGSDENGTPFVGVRSEIKLPRFGFSIPFLGRTADTDEDFKAYVNAMQFREPSNEECRRFFQTDRYQFILRLESRFGAGAGGYSTDYVPMEDSGC